MVMRDPVGNYPPAWVVEKVLRDGDAYTLGSYRERGPAIALLSLLSSTLEVERGASVEFDRFAINGVHE